MKHFITLADLPNFDATLDLAMSLKRTQSKWTPLAEEKLWVYCFLTPV